LYTLKLLIVIVIVSRPQQARLTTLLSLNPFLKVHDNETDF
jgi:hypothetical protein